VAAPGAGAESVTTGEALRELSSWVKAAEEAEALIWRIIDTPFVPASFWPNVGQGDGKYPVTYEQREQGRPFAVAGAVAAVLQGVTLRLDPLTALAKIYVVKGTPGLYAKLKVAIAQRAGHDVWTEDSTDTRAVVSGRRRGTQRVETVTITIEQARKAGWAKNDTYEKTPADMLWNRAAGRVCDRIAGDSLHGIPSAEDLVDAAADGSASPASRRVSPPPKRTALTAGSPMPPGRPAQARGAADGQFEDGYRLADEASIPPPSDTGGRPISEAEWRTINARFLELGVQGEGSRAARLKVVIHIIGREIERGSQMTAREAENVLANLADPTGPRIVANVLFHPVEDDAAAAQAADDVADDADQYDPTREGNWPIAEADNES
jgi:hypothetical protein